MYLEAMLFHVDRLDVATFAGVNDYDGFAG